MPELAALAPQGNRRRRYNQATLPGGLLLGIHAQQIKRRGPRFCTQDANKRLCRLLCHGQLFPSGFLQPIQKLF